MTPDLTPSPAQPRTTRRRLVMAAAGAAAALELTSASAAKPQKHAAAGSGKAGGEHVHVTADGTRIFYKDWGSGQPIVFSHGWPLTADAWDPQMYFLGMQGLRVIAHDRRGHGRSSQPWNGNDMDTYADDLAGLLDAL
ncbi:MAG: alpha/beta hydrolase, partial [Aquabacterium sp.]